MNQRIGIVCFKWYMSSCVSWYIMAYMGFDQDISLVLKSILHISSLLQKLCRSIHCGAFWRLWGWLDHEENTLWWCFKKFHKCLEVFLICKQAPRRDLPYIRFSYGIVLATLNLFFREIWRERSILIQRLIWKSSISIFTYNLFGLLLCFL